MSRAYDMNIHITGVTDQQSTEDASGRCMATWAGSDGKSPRPVVLEWLPSIPDGLRITLVQLRDELPNPRTAGPRGFRPEEVRSLRIIGVHMEYPRGAIAYECPYVPTTLRDVIATVPKPAQEDRVRLARLVATQIRSVHVHFRTSHLALRSDSFVFLQDRKMGDSIVDPALTPNRGLNLREPFLMGWGRESSPSIYQHTRFDAERKLWHYDVWSMLIILSEIAEWKTLDGATYTSAEELLAAKRARREQLVDPGWRGLETAKIFRFGFEELGKEGLDTAPWRDRKAFFDRFCDMLV